jgi:hypothetical protein
MPPRKATSRTTATRIDAAYQQTLLAVLAAQREALLPMRSEGEVSNETMNRTLREFDLKEARLAV